MKGKWETWLSLSNKFTVGLKTEEPIKLDLSEGRRNGMHIAEEFLKFLRLVSRPASLSVFLRWI